ncbi:hypothetical protein CHS0354_000870 [Potamilus streckersoni]|uniref:Uncharacterized protein n=1 Tax=Potamilus streckersoni TaxID=2493646 RepID=A0AAE0SIX9_9BIVA|nr:hypothetical protein CHS0354_000870 [Potamilus streckersoni]
MMHMSLIFMSLVAMRFIQSHGSINTTEQSFQSQYFINQTEHHPNLRMNPIPVHIWTAGNTMCRPNNVCGFQQKTNYKWCYTDYSDNWDYCCIGACDFQGTTYMWCQTGKRWTYCGEYLKHDIQGRPCLFTFPCGLHQEVTGKTQRFYWCYVDVAHNWDYCCAPWSECKKHGFTYNWCYVVNSLFSDVWKKCVLSSKCIHLLCVCACVCVCLCVYVIITL